jgi:hypothetical protein
MTRIRRLAAELNQAAGGFDIGRLQELRTQTLGLSRLASRAIFAAQSIKDTYAFHLGGRTELQFNIGDEALQGRHTIRRCVAFDLETSPTLPTIEPLLPKIGKFNEYVRSHKDSLREFKIWHYGTGERSDDFTIREIPNEWIFRGNFVALGRYSERDRVNVAEVLRDFDRLLPLYLYTQSKRPPRASKRDPFFGADCPDFAESTLVTVPARVTNVDLRHKRLQKLLHSCLRQEYGAANVRTEYDRVDAVVRHNGKFVFYELKTGCSVRLCMRTALGQLLEYAYWPTTERAHELVVVGESTPDPYAIAFLEFLRRKFHVPVYYRCLDQTAGVLGTKT